jgi:MerR family transcriptional regulator, thiopeptide resistance regulator
MADAAGERRWKVGDLAAATGLTVRALHHFDEIGLVRPAARSAGGHRLYTDDDVRRLYAVVALRHLEMPLNEIAAVLEGDTARLAVAVRRHLDRVEQDLRLRQRIRGYLASLLSAADDGDGPTTSDLLESMEEIMTASYFTQEQLRRLKDRHGEAGPDAFGRWRAEWAAIVEAAEAEIARGTDPAQPPARELARRWSALMADMSGGDAQIVSAMYAKLDGQGPAAATLGVVSQPVWEWMKRVFAIAFVAER